MSEPSNATIDGLCEMIRLINTTIAGLQLFAQKRLESIHADNDRAAAEVYDELRDRMNPLLAQRDEMLRQLVRIGALLAPAPIIVPKEDIGL